MIKKGKVAGVLAVFVLMMTLAACQNDNIQETQELLGTTREAVGTSLAPESVQTEAQPELLPEVEEVDWSAYFDGLTGAAVVYIPDEGRYLIYNEEISNTRRSPCSTFKIISALSGIENGLISEEDSVRTWSGEVFWNDKWNRDIDFKQAFQTSCIWYFREVINELGRDVMQKELDRLQYGNCDISDWEGYQNNNNSNRSLTGFWVESSLKISPKEQTEVMERIFGRNTAYPEETLNLLRDAMAVDTELTGGKLFGKTGLGMSHGIVVDAWFTGYAKLEGQNVFFCVYLGETENREVSSLIAKEIAIRLMGDYVLGEND